VPRIGKTATAGAYLSAPVDASDLVRFSTGCTVLDCVLGGGWVLGRMENIIGDKSSAKTGLAIEAMANFARSFPKGKIWYREAEAAFDKSYAGRMGLPLKRVKFWDDDYDRPFDTIEDMFEDLDKIVAATPKGVPGLYIVDSLDALSDRAEMERGVGDSSYGMGKPKKLSELFRKLVRKIEASQICLIIISQVRDNIGFGAQFEKYRRNGGKALDFYASHCVWLAHVGVIKKTKDKNARAVGVRIKAVCKKNKAGKAFRDCEMVYTFDYGVDDLTSSVEWLHSVGKLKTALGVAEASEFLRRADKLPPDEYRQATADVAVVAKSVWDDIDAALAPKRLKYG
jgi:RecA/RadA recombinase